jgi:N6-adenosine-specific RNA methylase IME4
VSVLHSSGVRRGETQLQEGRVKYATIVADPPWPYPEGWGRLPGGQGVKMAVRRGELPQMKARKPLPYPSMPLPDIKALPVADLADPTGCHLYMWTTNRYLRDAFDVVEAWGFKVGQTLVWCKTPMGLGPGGTFAQSTEYILTARRGSLRSLRRVDSTWFNWPRMDRSHSRKPDAFLDLVESVSPGPYLELFARRQRLGWDTWGNEALEHVEIAS